MPRPPSSFKSDFSNCAEVTSPPQKKRRRKEEKNNTPSSSIDENVVRMFFSGSHCCCTQHIKLVASRVGYNFRMFGSVVDKRTRGLVVWRSGASCLGELSRGRVVRIPFEQSTVLKFLIIPYHSTCSLSVVNQAWVVQKVDNAIHWINHYPVDSLVCFVNTYPLDSDLSSG